MKKIILIIITVMIGITFAILTYLKYPIYNHYLSIYTYNNKYTEDFAKSRKYRLDELSDTEYNKLKEIKNLNVENFSYNKLGDSIEITDYNGISENLVIPEKIDNKKVTSIKSNAFSKDSNLKTITLSSFINNIETEDFKDVEIITVNSNEYIKDIKANNENLNITILNDSDKINFNNTNTDFEYNIKDNEIEITSYSGDYLIVPETINGMKVTTVTVSINDLPNAIFIPSTITKINSLTTEKSYGNLIYLPIFIEICALIICLLIMIIVITHYNLHMISAIIVSLIYVIEIGIINYLLIDSFILVSIISTVIYIIISICLIASKRKLEEYDERVKKADSFILEALELAKKIGDKDLIEEIQYSDPISTEKTINIENEILDSLKNQNCIPNNLIKKIKERNEICKNNK